MKQSLPMATLTIAALLTLSSRSHGQSPAVFSSPGPATAPSVQPAANFDASLTHS
ncbi:hypothetical protein [Capsulimonas corticalis]|uniref:hypothetical protein n=1 Tax=Capsulimonas corticalis TaxID=2219043 RepID=UPI001402CDF8|nr:hypothetical protein [Capsulimonas corticalis]